MTRAKYIAETNELQELPIMDRPNELNYAATSRLYKHDMDNYNAHLATLRTIPCDPSCREVFKDGEEYEEGKDYTIKSQFLYSKEPEVWKTFDQPFYRDMAPERFMAFPITVKTEDDLWEDVCQAVIEYSDAEDYDCGPAILKLKSKYTLIKK